MRFTEAQIEQLLKPINPSRVLQDAKNFSHLAQQDVRAHLIRIFGFGNHSIEILNEQLLYEQQGTNQRGNETWSVAYKVSVRLTLYDTQGKVITFYEDGAVDSSTNMPSRSDAHDMAYKSAISGAIKRAATNLGDQFGLSLYNKGQLAPLVISSVAYAKDPQQDVQEFVPQQVSLGNEYDDVEASGAPGAPSTFEIYKNRLLQIRKGKKWDEIQSDIYVFTNKPLSEPLTEDDLAAYGKALTETKQEDAIANASQQMQDGFNQ